MHGPVVPELYKKYKSCGWSDIDKNANFDNHIFSSEILDVLEQVWSEYGDYSGNELEAISHMEQPWKAARGSLPPYASSNSIIEDKDMFIYYNEQAGINV